MGVREEAEEFLDGMRLCGAGHFLEKIDEQQRGVDFVLLFLKKTEGEIIAGDLARELHVSTARVAAILRRLEKLGYITRHSSRKDARKTVVELTGKGVLHTEEIRAQALQMAELLVCRVGHRDLQEFVRIAGRMKEALENPGAPDHAEALGTPGALDNAPPWNSGSAGNPGSS